MRETLSHADGAGTVKAFASSETPRQTTETIMGSPAGENSKHSLPQCRSSSQIRSTPASKAAAKPTVTRALNWKSPSGTSPSNVAALSVDSAFSAALAPAPAEPLTGSMKMSVRGCAGTVTAPAASSTRQSPPDEGASGNGTPGTLTLLAVLAALGQVPPAGFRHLDAVSLGRGEDTLPCLVAFGVADPFDLVEARDGITHVPGVGQWLLALLRKGELLVSQPVFFRGAHALTIARDVLAVRPGALRLARLDHVAPGSVLLPFGSHRVSPLGRALRR